LTIRPYHTAGVVSGKRKREEDGHFCRFSGTKRGKRGGGKIIRKGEALVWPDADVDASKEEKGGGGRRSFGFT